MTYSKIGDLLLHAYGSIKIIIFIFGLISTYANKNYIKLEFGKKLFNLDFRYNFLDYITLFKFNTKLT